MIQAAKLKTVCCCEVCSPCYCANWPPNDCASLEKLCSCTLLSACCCCSSDAVCTPCENTLSGYCCKKEPGAEPFKDCFVGCKTVAQCCCCVYACELPCAEVVPCGIGLCGIICYDKDDKYGSEKAGFEKA